MDELEAWNGRELPLAEYHAILRRTAERLQASDQVGTCLVSCSDEFVGDLRGGFHRDVAQPLMARHAGNLQRTFEISNLGGRMEAGSVWLVDDHFRPDVEPAERLLVVQVSAHVGRRKHGGRYEYGAIDRFGRRSTCCGALQALLAPPPVLESMRTPWLEELQTAFGPRRLAELARLDPATVPVRLAVVHAVLQAEAALTEIWVDPPQARTSILLVATVALTEDRENGVLPVGCHLVRCDDRSGRIERGHDLRSSPEALDVDIGGETLAVRSREDDGAADAPGDLPRSSPSRLEGAHVEVAARHVAGLRERIAEFRGDPLSWRVYARPLLRSFFSGLVKIAPELGADVLRVETAAPWVQDSQRRRVLAAPHPGPEELRILHDVEEQVQQLRHREAQHVLEVLAGENTPLAMG